jgi:hypothetical protein
MIGSRVQFSLYGRYEIRRYQGVTVGAMAVSRNDNMVNAGSTLDVFVQRWLNAGVSYNLLANQSDLELLDGLRGTDFLRHQVMFHLSVAYRGRSPG